MEDIIISIFENNEKLDFDNWIIAVVFAIGVFVALSRCVGPFFASGIEITLMSKEDESRRLVTGYILLFLAFCMVSYCFLTEELLFVINVLFYILAVFIYIIFRAICFTLKKKFALDGKQYWFENRVVLETCIIISFLTCVFGMMIVGNYLNWKFAVVLCAMTETVILGFFYLNKTNDISRNYLKLGDEIWYILRRVDAEYVLCAKENNIAHAQKVKLLKIEDILLTDIYMENISGKKIEETVLEKNCNVSIQSKVSADDEVESKRE